MAVKRFFLDGMIYNLLEDEPDVRARVKALVDAGEIQIVASPVLVTELRRSPFSGIPTWFKVIVEPEGIAISGLARSGMARSSAGVMYKNHFGASNKGFDAIIAHSALSIGATLVSNDRRCRERVQGLAAAAQSAMTWDEFKACFSGAISAQPVALHAAGQPPHQKRDPRRRRRLSVTQKL